MAHYIIFYLKTNEDKDCSFLSYYSSDPIYQFFSDNNIGEGDVVIDQEALNEFYAYNRDDLDRYKALLDTYKEYPTTVDNPYDIIEVKNDLAESERIYHFLNFLQGMLNNLIDESKFKQIYYYIK